MLLRWTTKPHGEDRFSAHACVSPSMPVVHIAATNGLTRSYGTHVFGGTNGRPEGPGGGAG